MKISATESYYEKQNKPWFYENCSKLLDQRKQAKLQWLEKPGLSNRDNVNNVNRVTRRICGTKRGNTERKINELETNSKNKNIRDLYRGINEFKKCYQHRTNSLIVKEENGDLLADSYNILNRWKIYFRHLWSVPGINDASDRNAYS
jgi:hypothetical protein